MSLSSRFRVRLGVGAEIAQRIKSWALARFGEGEEAWLVSEVVCTEPGRAPRQTIVALLHPAAGLSFRIACAADAVTEADIAALGDAAASLAAEACC